jgi:hypothetical protein
VTRDVHAARPLSFRAVFVYLLHTLAATIGCMLAAGFAVTQSYPIVHLVAPSLSRVGFYSVLFSRFYPVQAVIGFIAGYANGKYFHHRSAMWVWIIPVVRLGLAMARWEGHSAMESHWSALLHYFFTGLCHLPLTSACGKRLSLVAPVFAAISYSVGAFSQLWVSEPGMKTRCST